MTTYDLRQPAERGEEAKRESATSSTSFRTAAEMKVETGADMIMFLLRELGVEYISYTIGSTLTAFVDSALNWAGDRNPKLIETTHENIAVGVAVGYSFAKGKPMVAMIHSIPGILNSALSTFGAWIYRAPIVIIAGGDTPDSRKRSSWLEGTHDANIPNNIIRGLVKWDDVPIGPEGLAESVIRAYRVCATEPGAPTFVLATQDTQKARLSPDFRLPAVSDYAIPSRTGADPAVVEIIARNLVEAQRPVVITDAAGRYPKAPEYLLELCELLAIPVIDLGDRYNFPNTHPLNVTSVAEPLYNERSDYIRKADLVLALEVPALRSYFEENEPMMNRSQKDPFRGRSKKDIFPEGCKVIDVGKWTTISTGFVTDYYALAKTSYTIHADSDVFLEQLLKASRELLRSGSGGSSGDPLGEFRKERYARISEHHQALRKEWQQELKARWNEKPIAMSRLAAEVWEAIKGEDWVWVGGRLDGWMWRLWEVTRADRYVSHYRSSPLGIAFPMAIGASLANMGRLCVNLQPDGDLMMLPGGIWTAAHYKIPMLNVLCNNRSYYQDTLQLEEYAAARGHPLKDKYFGTGIYDPHVDFATLSRAYGGGGVGPIEEPDQISDAVRKGIAMVKSESKPVVVDVITEAAHS